MKAAGRSGGPGPCRPPRRRRGRRGASSVGAVAQQVAQVGLRRWRTGRCGACRRRSGGCGRSRRRRLGDAGDDADVARGRRGSATATAGARPPGHGVEREDGVDGGDDLGLRARPRRPPTAPEASSGMNSMKRTSMPLARPKAARSTISSSLTPRITTTLSFTGVSPASRAASMPASTRSRSSRRVSSRKRSRRRVSSEMLTRRRPAATRSAAMAVEGRGVGGDAQVGAERRPAARPAPGGGPAAVGSPPVSRMASTPRRSTITRASRSISSKVASPDRVKFAVARLRRKLERPGSGRPDRERAWRRLPVRLRS